MDAASFAVALFLAYYSTGVSMVAFHSNASVIDRPSYVYNGAGAKILAGAAWPIVASVNNELAWHVSCFMAASVTFSVVFFFCSSLISVPMLSGIMATMMVVPGLSAIINLPMSLVAALLWLLVMQPLGAKVPTYMNRN